MKRKHIIVLSVCVLICVCVFVVVMLVNNHKLKELKHFSDVNTLVYKGEATEEILEQDEREKFQRYQEEASLNELKFDNDTEQEMLATYGYADFKKAVKEEFGWYPSKVTVSSVKTSNSVIVRATYKNYYVTFVGNNNFIKGTVEELGVEDVLYEVFTWSPAENN